MVRVASDAGHTLHAGDMMVSHECVETQIQGGTTGIEAVRLYPPLTEENLSWAGILMYKSSRMTETDCTPVGCAGPAMALRIPVSGTKAAKQRSDAETYTVTKRNQLFENADKPYVAKHV